MKPFRYCTYAGRPGALVHFLDIRVGLNARSVARQTRAAAPPGIERHPDPPSNFRHRLDLPLNELVAEHVHVERLQDRPYLVDVAASGCNTQAEGARVFPGALCATASATTGCSYAARLDVASATKLMSRNNGLSPARC
jgi:hypothetical protein